ncbi:hypothetical protein D3C83_245400 [compost metagenome]
MYRYQWTAGVPTRVSIAATIGSMSLVSGLYATSQRLERTDVPRSLIDEESLT